MLELIRDLDYITFIDHLGTFAFAASGIRMAAHNKFDWFGAYVVGFVTAIGGGTIRDVLLGVTPFWMEQRSYLIVTGISLILLILFGYKIIRMKNTLFLFDSIGLGLFVVVGIEKSLALGFPFWVAIIMGMITGTVGGIIRDVLINETPLIFRKDIYALACILGGVVYYICHTNDVSTELTGTLAALSVIIIRSVSVKFKIQVPTVVVDEEKEFMKTLKRKKRKIKNRLKDVAKFD